MTSSNQNRNNQQSQENEQSNSQLQKEEIKWKAREVVVGALISLGIFVLGVGNYKLDQIKQQLHNNKDIREQTQLELNVINFSSERLYDCPQNIQDIYTKASLIEVLGEKFGKISSEESISKKNLVLSMIKTLNIEYKENCHKIDYAKTQNNEFKQEFDDAMRELKKVRTKVSGEIKDSIQFSNFKLDIAYTEACKDKAIEVQNYLKEELKREKTSILRFINAHNPNDNVFQPHHNQIIYQPAPTGDNPKKLIDETDAAYRLQELLSTKLPDIQVEEQPPENNITFIDSDTGERIQIITIAIGSCN